MTIHILHECIDSSDFYAEGNIITINKDKEKLSEKMFLLYKDCRDSEGNSVNQDETWCVIHVRRPLLVRALEITIDIIGKLTSLRCEL